MQDQEQNEEVVEALEELPIEEIVERRKILHDMLREKPQED